MDLVGYDGFSQLRRIRPDIMVLVGCDGFVSPGAQLNGRCAAFGSATPSAKITKPNPTSLLWKLSAGRFFLPRKFCDGGIIIYKNMRSQPGTHGQGQARTANQARAARASRAQPTARRMGSSPREAPNGAPQRSAREPHQKGHRGAPDRHPKEAHQTRAANTLIVFSLFVLRFRIQSWAWATSQLPMGMPHSSKHGRPASSPWACFQCERFGYLFGLPLQNLILCWRYPAN